MYELKSITFRLRHHVIFMRMCAHLCESLRACAAASAAMTLAQPARLPIRTCPILGRPYWAAHIGQIDPKVHRSLREIRDRGPAVPRFLQAPAGQT